MLLHKELKSRGCTLILASQSPRRRDLMRDAGLEFHAVSYEVEELYPSATPPKEVAEYLARLKSDNYPNELATGEILITADTVVILDNKILGKPRDEDDARSMLRTLSGREHQVVTGVTIRDSKHSVSFSTTSQVRFAELNEEQIDYYVTHYSPLDKAGSYGIQEWIGYIGIESIEGSFYNVMGLPIQRLCRELEQFID